MSQRPTSFQYEMVRRDKEIVEELQERAHAGSLRRAADLGLSGEAVERSLQEGPVPPGIESLAAAPVPETGGPFSGPGRALEAIVLEFGRPSLLVQNGSFEIPESSLWRRLLLSHRTAIETAIVSVGRIELLNHFTYDWVGTGWVVAPRTIVTNRHVAETFAVRAGDGSLAFANNLIGQPVGARIDLLEEHEQDAAAEISIEKIVYMAPSGPQHPDVAILQVACDAPLPEPLPLSSKVLERESVVGVIGYPAFDTRNGLDAMRRYFGEVYDVKRFAPGKVQLNQDDAHFFLSDYTSLGGNSGSAVIDLESGDVVGLHFAGRFREANFAVKVEEIESALAAASVAIATPAPPSETGAPASGEEQPEADKTHAPEHYDGRDGYRDDFLGSDGHRVPLPGLDHWQDDLAPVQGAPDDQPALARYRHFSVLLSKSRKLPVVTAVNIDGRELRRVPRVRDWYLDGRIAPEHQAGNELYKSNDLDRGHMVRRLDPVWGTFEIASEANDDTFHYVNAAPQHKDLNQKDWVDLESVVLDYADAKESKISVFTGPVLRDNDPTYRGVGLPREFWKVVTMVDADDDELAALGFVLSHSHLVRSLEETVLDPGSLKIYQVPLPEIAVQARIDLSHLLAADVLAQAPAPEEAREAAPSAAVRREIHGPADLILRRSPTR